METSYRAVGYRRVSMCEQVDGFSLDAQETHIRTNIALTTNFPKLDSFIFVCYFTIQNFPLFREFIKIK